MLKSQFVLTYFSDFFWVVYHNDRDQIMRSQTPCNNLQALQLVSSVFFVQATVPEAICMMMASARKAIILELYLIPVFRRMPLNLSCFACFYLFYT